MPPTAPDFSKKNYSSTSTTPTTLTDLQDSSVELSATQEFFHALKILGVLYGGGAILSIGLNSIDQNHHYLAMAIGISLICLLVFILFLFFTTWMCE